MVNELTHRAPRSVGAEKPRPQRVYPVCIPDCKKHYKDIKQQQYAAAKAFKAATKISKELAISTDPI